MGFGSLLGLCLIIQILTGLFLSIHYSRDASLAFTRVSHISRDVNYGWLLRIFHAHGARFFFYMFIFTCRSRAILWVILFSSYLKCGRYYPSSGYSNCLPRVCFTLRSNILLGCNCYYKFILYNPFYWGRLGPMNMGGFAVDNATLTRFFSLHFLLPFAVAGLAGVHLLFLHQTGRNNPLGLNRNYDKIPFHSYLTSKDLFGFFILFIFMGVICFFLSLDTRRPGKLYSCQSISDSHSYSTRVIFFNGLRHFTRYSQQIGGRDCLSTIHSHFISLPLYICKQIPRVYILPCE